MNLKKYLIVSFVIISLISNVQALSPKNKVRLEGAAFCAFGMMVAITMYNTHNNISRVEYNPDGSIRSIDRSSSLASKFLLTSPGVFSILATIGGLYNLINAQKIAEKRQQEQAA